MAENWIRMGREDAWQTLDRLGDKRDAVVFSRETTEVSWRALPFYGSYRLYRLVNYATLPVFSQLYLSNGVDFIALDGTAQPIYTVNVKDPVKISASSATAYLDFFFANVTGSEGEIFLIRDPRKMPFLDSLTIAQQDSVVSSFRPLTVTAHAARAGAFTVAGTIYYGGGLIAAAIDIEPDGALTFHEQGLLLNGIHFPYETYGRAWLEG